MNEQINKHIKQKAKHPRNPNTTTTTWMSSPCDSITGSHTICLKSSSSQLLSTGTASHKTQQLHKLWMLEQSKPMHDGEKTDINACCQWAASRGQQRI